MTRTERIQTIVIGGGQAGLSVAYHLTRRGLPCLVLDASSRIGDAWRNRWDSLRLFTPARYNGLDGFPFPASPYYFPTKDEMADHLEAYARRFSLPVRSGVRVERVAKTDRGYLVEAGAERFEANNVVVAMSSYQRQQVPSWAGELDPEIVQIHAGDYRSPSQLREGGVLVVGAGNSGADIALELASGHPVWLSGRDVGQLPFRIGGWLGRHFLVHLVLNVVFRRMLSVRTPMGRKMRPKVLSQGGPRIRVKSRDLEAAGVRRAPRTAGVRGGRPMLEGGDVPDVRNVVWCTGFAPDFSWIDLPVFGDREPEHQSGVVPKAPGLYFVGLSFLDSMASSMVHGAGRDAARIAEHLAARVVERPTEVEPLGALRLAS
jgi:putative flavoprotein involved in K+ transport